MPRRWFKLSERMHVRSATRHTGPRIACAQALGCCATIGGVGGVAYAMRSHSTVSSGGSSRLAKLLPKDLDGVASRTTLRALGVQLLLFGGFRPTTSGWQRSERPPASLLERVDLVAPTWKPRGLVDYSWPPGPSPPVGAPELSLFGASAAPPLAVPGVGATVGSLARALEVTLSYVEIYPNPNPNRNPNPNLNPNPNPNPNPNQGVGLDAEDFDGDARAALREMLTWRLPERRSLSDTASLTLLVLSFDATPDCRSVDDCPRPGPSNELLAATADAFVGRRWAKHGQRVNLIAQWEVAAALRTLRQSRGATAADGARGRVVSVGTPGVFENTAQARVGARARARDRVRVWFG